VTYPGTLSLSRAHLNHLANLLRGHRSRIGSRWRRLSPGRQALLVLAHLRNGDTYTRLAEGFRVGLARRRSDGPLRWRWRRDCAPAPDRGRDDLPWAGLRLPPQGGRSATLLGEVFAAV
jgi:hypothetical protein